MINYISWVGIGLGGLGIGLVLFWLLVTLLGALLNGLIYGLTWGHLNLWGLFIDTRIGGVFDEMLVPSWNDYAPKYNGLFLKIFGYIILVGIVVFFISWGIGAIFGYTL